MTTKSGHFSGYSDATFLHNPGNAGNAMNREENGAMTKKDQEKLVQLANAAIVEVEALTKTYQKIAETERDTSAKISARLDAADESIVRSEKRLAEPRIAQLLKDLSI